MREKPGEGVRETLNRKKLNCRKIVENGFGKNSRDAAQNDAAERSCRRDFCGHCVRAGIRIYVRNVKIT